MKVAVIGTGLIGGSVGLALKSRLGIEVTAFDRDSKAAAEAVDRGAADRAATSIADAVEDAGVVFIATPVGAITEAVQEAAPAMPAGGIVTDVGSTKSRVVLDCEAILAGRGRFLGGHPMAGSEDEGIAAARADLFDGAWWILTPTDTSDPDAYQQLHSILTGVGAKVMALTPVAHDELLALISHLPQLIATSLMNAAAERGREHGGLLALAAGGFRDVTRVAASNPQIWLDICRENSHAIAAVLQGFADRLLRLRDIVAGGDAEALQAELLSARAARRALPGKGEAGDLHDVLIRIPDRPGVLSEVTTLVGNLGVNIEDLQITHASEGGGGQLRLAVAGEEAAERVAQALRRASFDAKSVLL